VSGGTKLFICLEIKKSHFFFNGKRLLFGKLRSIAKTVLFEVSGGTKLFICLEIKKSHFFFNGKRLLFGKLRSSHCFFTQVG
jgi:hypothetical protein